MIGEIQQTLGASIYRLDIEGCPGRYYFRVDLDYTFLLQLSRKRITRSYYLQAYSDPRDISAAPSGTDIMHGLDSLPSDIWSRYNTELRRVMGEYILITPPEYMVICAARPLDATQQRRLLKAIADYHLQRTASDALRHVQSIMADRASDRVKATLMRIARILSTTTRRGRSQ